jgi:cell filamentation protein
VSDEDPYLDPRSGILRNELGFRTAEDLDYHERELTAQRAAEGVPKGKFDLRHLRAIHRHLFQDIYDWAGEFRTVEMTKGGSRFQFTRYIETGMADVHRRLTAQKMLKGLSPQAFAEAAGQIMGDVNFVHPFREGNGRTQLL